MTALDAISDIDTQQLAYAALTNDGALVLTQPAVVPTDCEKNPEFHDKRKVVMVFGAVLVPANREFGKAMYKALPGLLTNGSIKVCLVLLWMGACSDLDIFSPIEWLSSLVDCLEYMLV